MSKSFTLYIKISMSDYTSKLSYTAFIVTVTRAGCDCTAMLWNDPATTTATVSVGSTNTEAVPLPQADTSARSTNAAFDNCYTVGAGCATDGVFSAGSITLSGTDANSLSWVSFTSAGNTASNTQNIIMVPTKTEIGVHTFSVVFTPDNGSAYTYNYVVTVQCTVTSITQPAAPTSGLEHIVYGTSISFDFTNEAYTQTPDCGYAYTNSFTWTGADASSALIAN